MGFQSYTRLPIIARELLSSVFGSLELVQDSSSSTPSWKAGSEPGSMPNNPADSLAHDLVEAACTPPTLHTSSSRASSAESSRDSRSRGTRSPWPRVHRRLLFGGWGLSPPVTCFGVFLAVEGPTISVNLGGEGIRYVHIHAHIHAGKFVSCSGSGPRGRLKELPGEDGRPMSFFIARKPA